MNVTCSTRCGLFTSIFVATVLAFHSAPRATAQGALTPPGAPAPLMKTLDQVEARRPISALPFNIAASGSYYVTTNLVTTNALIGIIVNVPNVTLDLNGFMLMGHTGALAGISLNSSASNVVIRNGTVTGWGGLGIGGSVRNGSIENVHSLYNTGRGITVGDFWSIIRCQSRGNGEDGILAGNYAQVDECLSLENGGNGIMIGNRSIVRNCRIGTNTGHGVFLSGISIIVDSCTIFGSAGVGILSTATAGHRITGCIIQESALSGISLANCCHIVTDNNIVYSGFDGIRMSSESIIARNNVNLSGQATNNGAGIRLTSTRNRVEDNVVTSGDNGIAASGVANFVIRNQANGNSTNYFFPVSQNAGPIHSASGTITNMSPWANFSY